MVGQQVLYELFRAFPNAIINRNLEFVADPNRRVNSYFRLDNCDSRMDARCKVLEYLSRESYKSQHFNAKWRNDLVHEYHRQGINAFCGTNFTHDDMGIIYTYLGNGVNRKKTLAFIYSGYNLDVLEKEANHENL